MFAYNITNVYTFVFGRIIVNTMFSAPTLLNSCLSVNIMLNSYTLHIKYLQDAIDNVVKSVAGGEYLYNLKLYVVSEVPFKMFGPKVVVYNYVASGDVWGVKDANANIKGFKMGDKVVFTLTKDLRKMLSKNFEGETGKQYGGKVINFKGGEATIQLENSAVVDIPYANLTNLGQ